MSEYKAGLHKEVSAIFNGVSLPKDDGTQQPSAGPAQEHPDYVAPEPPVQKPPAPSHMTPAKPKPKQPPVQSPPQAAPAKQPEADTAIKAARRVPWRQTLEQSKNKLFALMRVNTTRQKVMVMLAPVLFIILISMFIRAFSTPSQKITGPRTFGLENAVVVSFDGEADWQVPELYPTTLRDPMQFGSVTTETGAGGLIIKGIVYSEDNPSAVIGGRIVHEGDKVLDVTIIKINENSIEFEAGGKRWTQKVQR